MKKTLLKKAAAIAASALAALSLIWTPAPAVKAASDPEVLGAGYSSVMYDNTDGLPTSDANAVVQTSDGFIWIGSYSGLIRYDGNEFYRYDSSNGVSSVTSLYVDSKDRLWIGTNDSGVFVLEKEEFKPYDREAGLKSSSVRALVEDENGNIIVGTTMGAAYVDPEGAMHAIDDPQLNREYVCELNKDGRGVVYGVTNSGAFFTLENLRVTAFYHGESFGYGAIYTVYPDPVNEGYVYFGTREATVVHGKLSDGMRDSEVFDVSPHKNVRSVQMIDGMVWICSDNGVGFLGDDGFVSLSDLPMDNSVEHVMEDFEGNLWFTSSRQGLMKIVKNRFTDISKAADLDSVVVNSTCLSGGLLYVGTDNGLIILDRAYGKVENKLTEMLSDVRIRSIHIASDGALWLGTNSKYGLVRYLPSEEDVRIYNVGNGLASDRARTIKELSDGRIAVATNAGVCVIENGEVTETYGLSHGIGNLEILCLEETPNGRIMAGSDGDGIYIIGDGKVERIGRDDGLRSEIILRMRRDPVDGELYWIITSNSISYLKNGKATTLHTFPYSNNFDMYFDCNDRVWVLSGNGIYVVKRGDMLSDENIDYILYDTSCGLPCSATANSYSWVTEEGTLYIAASNGVSAVNINDTDDGCHNVKLSVPYLLADDKYIEIKDGTAKVPADCKRLTICAYAFSYSLNNPHIKYMLEGFDDGPTELARHSLRPVTYTNLSGGSYTYSISVINTMTGEEDHTLKLRIVKEMTVFEQFWFQIALFVLGTAVIVGVILLYFSRKTKTLLKKQAEHKQLINEMTEVFASCIDMKDAYTNGHSHRVAKYTSMIAKRLGKSDEEVENMYRIALLHDIGKIGIPDSILNKPGKLDDEEFKVMKSHSQRGYDILKEVSIAPELAIGAGYHHERLDGRGYPQGITGDEIPEVAKIIAVADTFDAMYSTRPYRRRMELSDITAEIKRCSGTQLYDKAVDALMSLIDEGAFNEDRPD